ncbi:DinB family protein [Paenibacillus sp. MWE-103]|uniref:DinB family protein n=1 Tax=Paenibacillus artemisiicola TaxID=1172618 RepID=A0ABS3WH49_9BACL|nr:DinB family protein [Paenibacillus artemisiicola]MBO7747646.1 DinB family protein [Paenibacillus artemisiicola]
MKELLKTQYGLIRITRETLFAFLGELPPEKLRADVPGFGSGSIIRTHIHVADCYRYWLGSFAFGQKRADFAFATKEEIAEADVRAVRDRFKRADETADRFLDRYDGRMLESVTNEVKWQPEWSTTPLWLLTHTETHEFHHKGQIAAMARLLGYEPPNTDLE